MARPTQRSQAVAVPANNFQLLAAFMLAGIWAGSIVAFLLTAQNDRLDALKYRSDCERQATQSARLIDRVRAPRTIEYDEKTAPPLDPAEQFVLPEPTPQAPAPEAPAPQAPAPEVTAPPPANEIQDALGALKNLFSGNGSFADILKLVITGFAIFGGVKFGASDGLLKVILALFSKKSNFEEVVNEHLKKSRTRRRILRK